MADYSTYGTPAEEWVELIKSGFPQPLPQSLTLNERRDHFNEQRAKLHQDIYGLQSDNVSISDILIPTADGCSIQSRLYRPSLAASDGRKDLPLLIHLHSGGWHLGNLETEHAFCTHLCKLMFARKSPGFGILSINYRHTPEHKFPTQIDDAYAALEYFCGPHAQGQEVHGLRPTEVFLSGTSAGANLAIGCAIREVRRVNASQDGKSAVRITGLILTCAPTVGPGKFPYHLMKSREIASPVQNANDPMLSVEKLNMFWDLYIGAEQRSAEEEAYISPLLAENGLFEAPFWPPTSLHVAGSDLFRDEDLLFEEKLRSAGTSTRLHVYPGYPHAFNMLPQLDAAHNWTSNLIDDLYTKW